MGLWYYHLDSCHNIIYTPLRHSHAYPVLCLNDKKLGMRTGIDCSLARGREELPSLSVHVTLYLLGGLLCYAAMPTAYYIINHNF